MKSLTLFFKSLNITKWTLLTLTPILTLILDTREALLGLAIIIFIDLLTGVRKSLFKKSLRFNPLRFYFWRTVSSRGLRKTWRKTYEYGIGIIVFAVFETLVFKLEGINLFGANFSLTEFSVVTAGVVEVYSIFENMEEVSGQNILKKITSFIKDNALVAFVTKVLRKENKDGV